MTCGSDPEARLELVGGSLRVLYCTVSAWGGLAPSLPSSPGPSRVGSACPRTPHLPAEAMPQPVLGLRVPLHVLGWEG